MSFQMGKLWEMNEKTKSRNIVKTFNMYLCTRLMFILKFLVPLLNSKLRFVVSVLKSDNGIYPSGLDRLETGYWKLHWQLGIIFFTWIPFSSISLIKYLFIRLQHYNKINKFIIITDIFVLNTTLFLKMNDSNNAEIGFVHNNDSQIVQIKKTSPSCSYLLASSFSSYLPVVPSMVRLKFSYFESCFYSTGGAAPGTPWRFLFYITPRYSSRKNRAKEKQELIWVEKQNGFNINY